MLSVTLEEFERRFRCARRYHEYTSELEGVDVGTWLTYHDTATSQADLPLALSLIAKDVVPLAARDWQRVLGSRDFPYSPSPINDRCWSRLVWGYECPRSGNLHLDHHWPYSKGGPSLAENGIWLCAMHNRAKSDDIHLYGWTEDRWPSWVTMRLEHLHLMLS